MTCRNNTAFRMAPFFLLLLCIAGPAHAFDWDTHYSLNYYLARSCGYTPDQSRRIASACIRVDFCPTTEPIQAHLFRIARSHRVRMQFHAFLDEQKYPNATQHGSADETAAQQAILTRRDEQWEHARTSGNPGVFLHFLQDMTAHQGFGSTIGHFWAAHVPDFLAAGDRSRSAGMVASTLSYLKKFRETLAGQTWREPVQSQVDAVLDGLRSANPIPSFKDPLAAPDRDLADVVIQNGLSQWKESMPYLRRPYAYDYDEQGDIYPSEADLWTLQGNLSITFSTSMRSRGAAWSKVAIYADPTRKGEPETLLRGPLARAAEDSILQFKNLPVGRLLVRASGASGVTRTFHCFLNRREASLTLPSEPGAAAISGRVQECPTPSEDAEATGLSDLESVSGTTLYEDKRVPFAWSPQFGVETLPFPRFGGGGFNKEAHGETIGPAGQVSGWTESELRISRPAIWARDSSGAYQMTDPIPHEVETFDVISTRMLCANDNNTMAGSRFISPHIILGIPGISFGMRLGESKVVLHHESQLVAINNNDECAGWELEHNPDRTSAHILTGDRWIAVDSTPDSTRAMAINATQRMAGTAREAVGADRPCLWTPDGTHRWTRSMLGTSEGEALGINEAGMVVGWFKTGSGQKHAFLWLPDTVSGETEAPWIDLNAARLRLRDLIKVPFEDPQGTFLDLNSLLPSGSAWTLEVARRINNTNVILGNGTNNGRKATFLLYVTN